MRRRSIFSQMDLLNSHLVDNIVPKMMNLESYYFEHFLWYWAGPSCILKLFLVFLFKFISHFHIIVSFFLSLVFRNSRHTVIIHYNFYFLHSYRTLVTCTIDIIISLFNLFRRTFSARIEFRHIELKISLLFFCINFLDFRH